ncbi:MAG: L-seryl-tRNA(Sec) selenium transferase, partial [Anaerolineales bacterium]
GETTIPRDEVLIARAEAHLETLFAHSLRPVINATGVILHTNLGRAPLSAEAIEEIRQIAEGYSDLEFDLATGKRGKRQAHVELLVADIIGAEAAMVVNNNAAATMLALAGLAAGREVIISRGQLVEIGGGFRMPDVMRQSGVHMVEVGTTNRTLIVDYENAITPETALLMRAHYSNFKQIGFVQETNLADLADLAHTHGLLLLDDLGSGALLDTAAYGLAHEPTVGESLAADADVITFSGDKLLGGPQAGIIVGKKAPIDRLKRHPLARALRVDKLTIAALVVTLDHYRRGQAETHIPVWCMLATPLDDLQKRAEDWASACGGEVIPGESTVGGGSLPGETLPTWLCAHPTASPQRAQTALRECDPPIIARVQNERLLLDPRTVLTHQHEIVKTELKQLHP